MALNKNKKLDTIIVAFFNSAIINFVNNSNKKANNSINVDNYIIKKTILKAAKE